MSLLPADQKELFKDSFMNRFLNGDTIIDESNPEGMENAGTYTIISYVIENLDGITDINEVLRLLYQLTIQSYTGLAEKLSDSKGKLIDRITNYIKTNYKNQISLQLVADEFDISLTYLSQYFKKSTGMNFIDFVRDIRIEKAKEMLHHKKISINEVAELTGFETVNTFIRVFKKLNGITPGEYKSNLSIRFEKGISLSTAIKHADAANRMVYGKSHVISN